MRHVTVGLYLPSAVISAGLSAIIAGVTDVSVACHDMWGTDLSREIKTRRPSLLLVDPMVVDADMLETLKEAQENRLLLAGVCACVLPVEIARRYDEILSIYDSAEMLVSLLRRIASTGDATERVRELSPREKTVVVGVVKGLSNKEIAEEMHVSVNTVMTHRRNIAAKLHIHSAAGLTIYAIVSKLVRLDDVKAGFSAL